MTTYLQPCHWHEHDVNFKYVVDVYGRTDSGDIARLRLRGFQPYFYLRAEEGETCGLVSSAIVAGCKKQLNGLMITEEHKLDAMKGFNGLQPTRVWKLRFPAIWMFKLVARELRAGLRIGSRRVNIEDIYEANLPPYLRLFHERDISPASPLTFEGEAEGVPEGVRVDVCYDISYKDVEPFMNINIPLYVLSYDIETYSTVPGQFPVATNPGDEVIQIGMSFRWSDDLMTPVEKYVLVSGEVTPSGDPSVKFISCRDEQDLLLTFQRTIQMENPDIIAGYNTFGFDDGYIAERCQRHRLELQLGREDVNSYSGDFVKTEKKTFELASGKYAVRYFDLIGRMNVDLLLVTRREQNLDSYKLDSVASTFLRDKVSNIVIVNGAATQMYDIHTKNTRGLHAGNYVRFDVVTNTVNPYREGTKFRVKEVHPKKFTIELPMHTYLFDDLTPEDMEKLEWCFSKNDISLQDMLVSHTGTPEQRAEVARYCIQDCDLVCTLMAKLDTLVNARGMADVCRVPIDFIFLRGQGIKIFSAVAYNAHHRGQIIMQQESIDGDVSYEGAIVLPPKIGLYLDQPIPVLDFNSLYPSNMIAYNISPDTLVYVKTFNMDGRKISHTGIDGEALAKLKADGYVVDEISYDTHNDTGDSVGRVTCGYIQPRADDPRTVGILPLTLDILLKKRKETRKRMETTEDEAQVAVLNGLQLAYKVVANSVYGQCGSKTSPIRKFEVAACTTAAGRDRIMFAKRIVVHEFGAEVVYGDSVANYTPVLIRENGEINIVTVEDLGTRGTWFPCKDSDKEYCELSNIESWTESGWTPMHRIIRHKLASHKKMIRVLTHTGLVDVTDDHSLLRPNGTEVSSKQLNIGDELLHATYPDVQEMYDENEIKARIAGFFFGDGSCGYYNCPSGKKSSWALNNANVELLNMYKEYCIQVYPELSWDIYPTITTSSVFKLIPTSNKEYGVLVKFIREYRSMMYSGQAKVIPAWVLNGTRKVRQAFWDGMYDADGDKDTKGFIRIDQKHQVSCAQIAWIANTLGYSISLNDRRDKLKVCRVTCTTQLQRKNPVAIKKMYEIPYEGYVYDLTTANHHFQAGVGQMIVHNTDSIFIKFPTTDLVESISLGQKAAARITSAINRPPYKIEYEKTFYPFILFCRKRYVGLMYEDDPTKCKRKTMGIALKRRDNAPIVKDVFGGALDLLLEKRDIRLAQRFVQDMLVRLMKNEFPLEKYVVTKQLRDDYKNPEQIAHRVLADRMAERDPGTAPQVGDRIPYIYVANRKDEKKQGDRIEHLDYVREKKLKPDVEFYITHQIQNPVAQLFALAIDQLEGYRPKVDYEKLLAEYMASGMDEETATLKVLDRKEKELDSILFMGASYLTRHKRGPMDAFLQRK